MTYLPALANTSYEGVTLRHLLQMSCGVAWSEDATNADSDVRQLSRLNQAGGGAAQPEDVGKLPRKARPGEVFNYNTGETDIAGAVLRGAIRRTLSEYLSEKIWRPFGMQADGYRITMRGSDLERGGCCISATLRDYARIGLFALSDGVTDDGPRVLPEGWMAESTRSSPASRDMAITGGCEKVAAISRAACSGSTSRLPQRVPLWRSKATGPRR